MIIHLQQLSNYTTSYMDYIPVVRSDAYKQKLLVFGDDLKQLLNSSKKTSS